jgi:hypothetical protein
MPAITPITMTPLTPFKGTASASSIRRFQVKIGSLLYVAIITRPDVAFAVSRLTRYTKNPSLAYHYAINRALRYLKTTRAYALIYGGHNNFKISYDASFINNPDRKSS